MLFPPGLYEISRAILLQHGLLAMNYSKAAAMSRYKRLFSMSCASSCRREPLQKAARLKPLREAVRYGLFKNCRLEGL